MTVLLTGATGYVGGYVLDALLERGHSVRALVRSGGDALAARDGVDVRHGDVTDAASLEGAFDGADAVIHLVGIIDESPSKGVTFERIHVGGTRRVVEAAQAAGVTRFVHMSANGARPDGPSAYQRTKWKAEEIVRAAGAHRARPPWRPLRWSPPQGQHARPGRELHIQQLDHQSPPRR